jgi:fermentation-respiration switch protein FrsA (DUF1100 family)
LIAHGDPDPVIPTDEAQLLFAAAAEPKQLLILREGGHNLFGALGEQYLTEVEAFILQAVHPQLVPDSISKP